jgi:hypothetical protein
MAGTQDRRRGGPLRLSEWAKRAPHQASMAPKVLATVTPILTALGAAKDPPSWIAWGEDPASRYLILSPTDAGLVEVHVRVNVPQEGPRSSGKLVRWNRVQTGELSVEFVAGHRLVGFQVENVILRGTDEDGDAIAAFALEVYRAIDARS